MKKITPIIILALIMGTNVFYAQDHQSGSVIYEEIVKLEIKMEGEMAAMMKDFPKERKSEKILCFNPGASLYDSHNEEEAIAGSKGMWHGEGNVNIVMKTPENKIYTDLIKKEIIEQREFMTRMFLINGDMPEKDWKITGQQEMILDYPCIEATHTDTSGMVTRIWFTPSINIPAGPGNYCNLPGLVLKVDINEGQRVLEARSISFDDPGKDVFEKPDKGKKVSRDEFDTIVAEKMKEMGAEGSTGGGGIVIIRTRK